MRNHRPPATLDEVVAANIFRLRGDESRASLAKRLTDTTGNHWPEARLIDLEGKRSPDKPPRPARWSELVSLALALNVSVYELVLPVDDDTRVVVAIATETVDYGTFPDTEAIPENLRGKPKTGSRGYARKSDRDELGRVLFGVPGRLLTADKLESLAEHIGSDMAVALADIANVQEGLARAVALIESVQENEQEND